VRAPIALDAMGGDYGPEVAVRGAARVVREGIDLVLVGDAGQLEPLIDEVGIDVPIVHASEVIGMTDDPARALREKKDASVLVAAKLVASGDVGGFVSTGSTGASMAAAAFVVGRLKGISRPGVASLFPHGPILLDAGANTQVRPEHLVQFAIMGTALAQTHGGLEAPRVGLLNIGGEDSKGRDLEKETLALLRKVDGINFIGNVEGTDLIGGRVDVFVTDGFTGNVVLKTAEAVSRLIFGLVAKTIVELGTPDAERIQGALGDLANRLAVDENGGAPLLGIDGVVVVAHGSSNEAAVASACRLAAESVARDLPGQIEAGLARMGNVTS
jgi:phosphate acyltransferase